MLGLKLYPNFELQPRSTKSDEKIVTLLRSVKKATQAKYVNYSVVDYACTTPVYQHFLTYPVHWVSLYFKHHFQNIDPLVQVDCRLSSMIDWQEYWHGENELIYYQALVDAGIGEHGLTLNSYIDAERYGAMSLLFDQKIENWVNFRDLNLAKFRIYAEQLVADMNKSSSTQINDEMSLTERERDCIYWAAIGKTDAQIGDMLGISRWTVNTHMNKTKMKLDCPNRTSAVAKAINLELVDIT